MHSIIFSDNLIALFDPGNLVWYKILSLDRNTDLGNKLNTKKFKYQLPVQKVV